MTLWKIFATTFIVSALILVGSSIGTVVLLAMLNVGPAELAWSLGVAEQSIDHFMVSYTAILLALLVVAGIVMTIREKQMRAEATTQVIAGQCPKTCTTKKMKALQ